MIHHTCTCYSETGKDRLISFLQVFYIILVVLGHSFHVCPIKNEIDILNWMHYFRMPLSMWVSGFLLAYTTLRRTTLADMSMAERHRFILKKIKRLIVPYVAISSAVFIPKTLLGNLADRPVPLSWQAYAENLLYPNINVIGPFWFLPTLFIVFCFVVYASAILRFVKFSNRIVITCIAIAAVLLFLYNPFWEVQIMNLRGLFYYLIYFLAGYFCCYINIACYLASRPWTTLSITAIASVVFFYMTDFHGRSLFLGFTGIFLCYSLAQLYVQHNRTYLNWLFGSSYCIYLFSWFPQSAVQQGLMRISGGDVPWQVSSVFAFILGIIIPWIIYLFIVKNKNKRWGRVIVFLTGQ